MRKLVPSFTVLISLVLATNVASACTFPNYGQEIDRLLSVEQTESGYYRVKFPASFGIQPLISVRTFNVADAPGFAPTVTPESDFLEPKRHSSDRLFVDLRLSTPLDQRGVVEVIWGGVGGCDSMAMVFPEYPDEYVMGHMFPNLKKADEHSLPK